MASRRRLFAEAAAEARTGEARQATTRAAQEAQAEAQRQAETAARFRHLSGAELLQAAQRLQAKMPGRISLGSAQAMILEAEEDRRMLFELQNRVRVPHPVTGASALDDPDLVRQFEAGGFSFRRAQQILQRGRLGLAPGRES